MKRILTTIALALSILLVGTAKNSVSAQGFSVDITYQTFYDELSPYGRWIDYPEYGYVWAPDLGPDFQPYRTGGQWVWSNEYDWMWVSDYSWGWAPFHYGRWFYDPFYGWMWVPGYDWSPGWVSWRTGGDYYGWAPLGPGISMGIGFSNYNPPYNYWSFAPRRYISSPRINSYCVDRSRNVTIINTTTIINNYGSRKNVFVNGGPRRYEVERFAGRIRSVNLREANRPGEREFRNNQVRLFRPQIRRQSNQDIAPRVFDRYENNRRPNVFDRGGNKRTNREESRSGDQQREIIDQNRRNVFDRNRRNMERNTVEQPKNDRRQRPNVFDRDRSITERNTIGQPNNDRRERPNVLNRNRNITERNTNEQPNNDRRERPNVFDRNRNISERNTNEQPNSDRRERPNVFDRNANRNPQNRDNESRRFQQRNNDQQPNGRIERREIQQRRDNPFSQNNRREISSQSERPNRQFRDFDNRRSGEQRGNNNNARRGRFERND